MTDLGLVLHRGICFYASFSTPKSKVIKLVLGSQGDHCGRQSSIPMNPVLVEGKPRNRETGGQGRLGLQQPVLAEHKCLDALLSSNCAIGESPAGAFRGSVDFQTKIPGEE